MSKDLTAQDIKRIRRKYGLTQQGFARLLGLGEASVVRYENGQTPSKANANLIRAADNPAFMRDCFERDGDLLSHEQRGKAEQIIYALVTFDEDGDIMDINEISHIKPRIISEGHLNTVRLSEIRGQIECLKNMVDSRQAKAA